MASQSELLANALQIKQEVVPEANNAERIGEMFEQIIRAATKPYDTKSAYKAGEYVYYNSSVWQTLATIGVGETPLLVPEKWKKTGGTQTLDQLIVEKTDLLTPAVAAEVLAGFQFTGSGLNKKPKLVTITQQTLADLLASRIDLAKLLVTGTNALAGNFPVLRKRSGTGEMYVDYQSPADFLNNQKATICKIVAGCNGTTPTDPKSSFKAVHYVFVDDSTSQPPQQQYDYVLGDGTYAGTHDTLSETGMSWWAVKRGIGPVNVDVKFRKKGSLGAFVTAGQNLSPNYDRPDVVAAPGINTPNGSYCGRNWPIPTAFRTGEEIEVWCFIAGTDVPLKSTPRYITLQAQNQPREGVYRITGDNVNEGGLAQQQTLQQQWTDDKWYDVTGRNWIVQDESNNLINGVSIANGLLKAEAGSVNQTTFVVVGCQPTDRDQFVSVKRQIIDAGGCTRPSGLTTFTAFWNIAPKGQNAHRFDSLDQANNEMGAYYDQPDAYNVGQFPFQAARIALNEAVFNRNNTDNCERVDDGIFYYSDSSGANTIKKAGRIRSGVIVELKATQYETPKPLPDTSWATLTDPFDTQVPAYMQSNGTVWNWSNGSACVDVSNMVRGDTGALILDMEADRILALITVGARDVTDPRYGVGLKYSRDPDTSQGATGGLGGFNLLISRQNGVNQIIFLDDHRAFGPGTPYDWQPNTQYYVEMQYTRPDANTRRLLGRVWRPSENQPTNWPYSWDVYSRSGQAAVIGGSNYPGAGNVAAGCVTQVWVQQTSAPPRLTNVAQYKKVSAPYNTLGGGFDSSFVVDNSDKTYSTDCLQEYDSVSVVVDLNGLARPEQVQLVPRLDYPNAMPIDFTIDGSLDGKQWTNLISIVNLARGVATITYDLPSTNGTFGQFRFMRIHATRIGMAEPTDCRRLQINEFRVLAPSLDALPADQKSTVFEVARAFIGAPGSNGESQRDLLYFVKNGVSPQGNATGIAPTWGFKNLTTGSPDSLSSKSEMYSIASSTNPSWQSIMNKAKAQGFEWFTYANAGSAGQTVRMRYGGNASETAYREFDFIIPADGTNIDLTTIYPV